MEKVAVDELDRWMGPASIKRPLGKALGAEHMAVNYYELEPGDSFAFGYHAHENQEELFYILDGEATFETETGDIEVDAGDAIYFKPGEFQQGHNRGETPVRALAIGAPQDAGELTLLRSCETCGEQTNHEITATDDRSALVTICQTCGTETGRFT